MKYLQSEDRTEQKGRAEDGPVGLKHKWTDWPQHTPGADLINSGKKKTQKATKNTAKTSTATTSTATKTSSTSQGAGKK